MPRSAPVSAIFPSENFVIGGGVAIFHVASNRVVLCYQPAEDLWFLPKGRRDVNEETVVGAEREGFEEVCQFGLRFFKGHVMLAYSGGGESRLTSE